jgi:hypothetical protein
MYRRMLLRRGEHAGKLRQVLASDQVLDGDILCGALAVVNFKSSDRYLGAACCISLRPNRYIKLVRVSLSALLCLCSYFVCYMGSSRRFHIVINFVHEALSGLIRFGTHETSPTSLCLLREWRL